MFVNISNHPSAEWPALQLAAAKDIGGEIRDIVFPNVSIYAGDTWIGTTADQLAAEVPEGATVMAQGEFALTFALTTRLKARGISVVVAVTERRAEDRTKPDGTTEKVAIFAFVRFRNVPN